MDTQIIQVHGEDFKIMIKEETIKTKIANVASQINQDYKDKENIIFFGILNGAFMFMGELMQHIKVPCKISFIKISSYSGTSSSGKINQTIGLPSSLKGEHVVIVEDIVDTGFSIDYLLTELSKLQPASIKVASLLMKREAYKKDHKIDYIVFEIPNKFVIGFGLDYDQLGRNYPDIYEKC
jgi:hypoxanthine phosphoribosyltransferase